MSSRAGSSDLSRRPVLRNRAFSRAVLLTIGCIGTCARIMFALCSPVVKETSVTNFGLVIAFLIPGFTALWGVTYFSETVRSWLGASAPDAPTVGGFLYGTLASVAAGLTISTVRWGIVDTLHHSTGIRPPTWDFSRLQENLAAVDTLVDNHYRYYQFYANMLVAAVFSAACRRIALPSNGLSLDWVDAASIALSVILFAGSRDTLRKYYARMGSVLSGLKKPISPPRSRPPKRERVSVPSASDAN